MSLDAINEGEDEEKVISFGNDREVLAEGEEGGDDSFDEDEDEEEYEGYKEVQQMESSFEDILTSNRSLIEGLRGTVTYDDQCNVR